MGKERAKERLTQIPIIQILIHRIEVPHKVGFRVCGDGDCELEVVVQSVIIGELIQGSSQIAQDSDKILSLGVVGRALPIKLQPIEPEIS